MKLHESQREALLAINEGDHVLVRTPTGSGKSLIARFAHFRSMKRGSRSVYTAPTRALTNEKFEDLARHFGQENVGIRTGDRQDNVRAPVLCCTAEVLAEWVVRYGQDVFFDSVVMDEFHFISDPDRGTAWHLPLVEMRHSQFVLLSGTMPASPEFASWLQDVTGREVSDVRPRPRPVEVEKHYSTESTDLLIERLVHSRMIPAYLVLFSRREAHAQATALAEFEHFLDADERARLDQLVRRRTWPSPFGSQLRTMLAAGVAVHHGGMLARERRFVEQLARESLVKIICGTDTLGIGVNLPLQTVVLSSLVKFDGTQRRMLTSNEFKQIVGRAGRQGLHEKGFAFLQAPEARKPVATRRGGTGRRRIGASTPPPEYNEEDFTAIQDSQADPLDPQLNVSHGLVVGFLLRGDDGREDMRNALQRSFPPANPEVDRVAEAERLADELLTNEMQDWHEDEAPLVLEHGLGFSDPTGRLLVRAAALARVRIDGDWTADEVFAIVEATADPRDVRTELDTSILELRKQKPGTPAWRQARMKNARLLAPLLGEPTGRTDRVNDVVESVLSDVPWIRGELAVVWSSVVQHLATGLSLEWLVETANLHHLEGDLLLYVVDVLRGLRVARSTVPELDGPIRILGGLVDRLDLPAVDFTEPPAGPLQPTGGST